MKALIVSEDAVAQMGPITYSNVKLLIPVANKPMIFYVIEKIAKIGIMDIGIVVGDNYEQIKSSVGMGEKWNVNITYIHQPYSLGIAHAVKTSFDFLKNSDFLIKISLKLSIQQYPHVMVSLA